MDRDLDSIRFVTRHFKDLQGLRSMVPLGLLQLTPGIIAGFGGVPRLLPWIIGFQVVASVAAFFLMFSSRSYYRSYGHVEPKRAAFAKDPALSIFSPAGPAPQLAEGPPQSRRHLRFFLLVGAGFVLLASLHAIGPRVELHTDGWALDPWLQFDPPVVETMDSGLVAKVSRFPWFRIEETRHVLRLIQTEWLYALWGSFLLGMWLMRDRRLSQSYYLVFGLLLLGLAALGASLEIAPTPALFSYALLALAHPWIAQVLQGSVLVIAGLLDHRQLVRALGERPAQPLRAV